MEYPLFEITINEDEGAEIEQIALVKKPAIEINFIALAAENAKAVALVADEERHEIIGPALIPDMHIFRSATDDYPDHNITFSAESIRNIARTFMRNGRQNDTNLEHTAVPAGSYVFQSYITDSKRGINAPKEFPDLPDGTWVLGMKVDDPEVWKAVKSGELKGFSVEGFLLMNRKNNTKRNTNTLSSITDTLENLINEL